MSNTPKFALRKPYSIREELAALNPFVRREQTSEHDGNASGPLHSVIPPAGYNASGQRRF